MILNALSIDTHLKTELGRLYMLVGKEIVMLDETLRLLFEACKRKSTCHKPIDKVSYWIEEEHDWNKIEAETQHYCMFNNTLVIDAKYHKTTLDKKSKDFLSYFINQPRPDCILILQAPNVSIKPLHQLFQKLQDAHLVDIPMLKDKTFIQFIENRFKLENLRYHKAIPNFIAQLTHGNPLAARQCISQLSLLMQPEESIELTLVKQLLDDVALFPLYTFNEACIGGNSERAIRLLHLLHQSRTEPVLLLWWIVKMTRQLIELHHYLGHKNKFAQVCKALNIWSHQNELYFQACNRIPFPTLNSILQCCKHLDTQLKSHSNDHVWNNFEQIVLTFCEPNFPLSTHFRQDD